MNSTKNRCTTCKRKLPLTAYACKCNLYFCTNHMIDQPEGHKCTYDYYNSEREKMLKNLSTLVYKKKETYFTSI